MNTFHTFPTLQAARDYRHEHRTGGWIFAPDDEDGKQWPESILFPPEFFPSMIFSHPLTSGRSGRLIGGQ